MKKIYQEVEVVITTWDCKDVLESSGQSDGVAGDLDWLTKDDALQGGGV